MMTFNKSLFTTVFACLALLSSAFSTRHIVAQTSVPNVVPGRSLGRVSLGFTRAQVHRALGKPDKTLKLKSGLTDDIWRAKTTAVKPDGWGNTRVVRHKVEVLYRRGRVVQIEATSPVFVTRSGFSTQTPLQVLDTSLNPKRFYTYASPGDDVGGALMYYLNQVQAGIAFEYGPAQDTWARREGSDTLIVHPKSVPVIQDQGWTFYKSEAYVPDENP